MGDDQRVFMCRNGGCEIEVMASELQYPEDPGCGSCDTCGCDFGFRELPPRELLDRMYSERSGRLKAERKLQELESKGIET